MSAVFEQAVAEARRALSEVRAELGKTDGFDLVLRTGGGAQLFA